MSADAWITAAGIIVSLAVSFACGYLTFWMKTNVKINELDLRTRQLEIRLDAAEKDRDKDREVAKKEIKDLTEEIHGLAVELARLIERMKTMQNES